MNSFIINDIKLLINATILDSQPSGLGVYTQNILSRLGKYLKLKEKLVYTSAEIEFEDLRVIKTTQGLAPSRGKYAGLVRFLWTQSILIFKHLFNQAIIYCPTQYASLFSFKKQIITIHDLLPLKFPKQNKPQYLYYKYFLPILIAKCEKIITISENTKQDLLQYYKMNEQKIHVIYNGFDEEKFNVNVDANFVENQYDINKYILIVGASYPHKNIDKYFMAYKKIKDKIEEKIIIIGGKKQYKDYLKKIATELEIEKDILFMPYIEDEDLPCFYKSASLLAYPTLYEGFGLPPIEAMACGTPVVVSNTSSLPEVVGDAALLFDPNDIEDMADKTLIMLKDKKIREKCIEEGFKNIKRFSWDLTAQEIAKVLEEACK